MTKLSTIAISPFLLLAACVGEATDEVDDRVAFLADGDPSAAGVLRLVNAVSLAVLDDDVGLDGRAAANIVAHRDGADGVRGTADDDPFGTIAELDAIPYVGPAALDSLVAYAEANGWTSRPTRVWCDVLQQLRLADGTSLETVTLSSELGGGFGFGSVQVKAGFTHGPTIDDHTLSEIRIQLLDGTAVVSAMSATVNLPVPRLDPPPVGFPPANSGTYRLNIPAAYQTALGTVPGVTVVGAHLRCALWQ